MKHVERDRDKRTGEGVPRLPAGRPWRDHGSVTNDECFGGDLAGITSKLDYLQNLGINGLYLTPINESPSNHKYDTTDYTKIDPRFGDEETLIHLVEEAHKRGIRRILQKQINIPLMLTKAE